MALPLRMTPQRNGEEHSEILLRLVEESLADTARRWSKVSERKTEENALFFGEEEGGSMKWKLWRFSGGLNTGFSITSVKFRVLQEPNEDRNIREIRILRRFWFSMAE